MNRIEIVGVDERDNNWEEHHPRFRVYLHGSGESSTAGWTDTYDITGADVMQVIDWAQRQAGDSLTYAVALVYDDKAHDQLNPGCGRGLVWLVGMDGNDSMLDRARRRRRSACWPGVVNPSSCRQRTVCRPAFPIRTTTPRLADQRPRRAER